MVAMIQKFLARVEDNTIKWSHLSCYETLSVILNMILITCKINSTMRRKTKDNMR